MATGFRITGGSARGRALRSVSGMGVRPTAGRVREAVFSILGDRVKNAEVLDLFAGVGGLGLEALSRGALHVDFVENNPRHAQVIDRNLEHLGFEDDANVIRKDAQAFLRGRFDAPYDIIFMDPPYEAPELLAAVLPQVLQADIIAPSGVVVVEHAHTVAASAFAEGWEMGRAYRYGPTAITLLYPPESPAMRGNAHRRRHEP